MLDKATRDRLVASALEAREAAYAPYSDFKVGAALLTASGAIYQGCNVENAAFGAGICAERTAAVKAVAAGDRVFVAVAVTGFADKTAAAERGLAYPCGICRQVLYELSAGEGEMRVIVGMAGGEVQSVRLSDLLPHGFRLAGPGTGAAP